MNYVSIYSPQSRLMDLCTKLPSAPLYRIRITSNVVQLGAQLGGHSQTLAGQRGAIYQLGAYFDNSQPANLFLSKADGSVSNGPSARSFLSCLFSAHTEELSKSLQLWPSYLVFILSEGLGASAYTASCSAPQLSVYTFFPTSISFPCSFCSSIETLRG